MKNIQIIKSIFLTLLTVGIIFGSCQSFLEEEPKDFLGTGNFYSNVREAEAAVIGIYELLNTEEWGDWTRVSLGEQATEIFQDGVNFGNGNELNRFEWTANNQLFRDFWQAAFTATNRANDAVDNILNIESVPDEKKAQLIGEARFLRSLAYFELVRAFGDIPLRKSAFTGADLANPTLERSSVDSVYAFIFEDLKKAQELLTEAGQLTTRDRASVGAATALLGKAYLTYAGLLKYQRMLDDKANQYYKLAEDELVKVMNMDYELFKNYAKVFYPTYKNGVEHIFSVQFMNDDGQNLQSAMYDRFGPRLRGTPYTYVQMRVNSSFKNSIPEHFRKRIAIPDSVQTEEGIYTYDFIQNWRRWQIGKYYAPKYIENNRRSNHNMIILRYADVLLMAAEARSARLGGPDQQAIEWFNQVRDRATTAYVTNRGLDDLTDNIDQAATDFSKENLPLVEVDDFSNHEEFVEVLVQERMWEFAGEGHARWDQIRMGKYLEENDDARERHLLYPIPQREMNLHQELWTQNPGY